MDYLFGMPLDYWAEVQRQIRSGNANWERADNLIIELAKIRQQLYIAEGKLKAIGELL